MKEKERELNFWKKMRESSIFKGKWKRERVSFLKEKERELNFRKKMRKRELHFWKKKRERERERERENVIYIMLNRHVTTLNNT